jgi:hypothetical protein
MKPGERLETALQFCHTLTTDSFSSPTLDQRLILFSTID